MKTKPLYAVQRDAAYDWADVSEWVELIGFAEAAYARLKEDLPGDSFRLVRWDGTELEVIRW
jgi:hypothetical protein